MFICGIKNKLHSGRKAECPPPMPQAYQELSRVRALGSQHSTYQMSLLPQNTRARPEIFGGQQLDPPGLIQLQVAPQCGHKTPSCLTGHRLLHSKASPLWAEEKSVSSFTPNVLWPPAQFQMGGGGGAGGWLGRGCILAKTPHLFQEHLFRCGDNPHQGAADSHEKTLGCLQRN